MTTAEQAITQALQLISARRLEQAQEICRRVLQQQPQSAPALHAVGLIAYMENDYDTAIEQITHAVQIDGNNPQYYSNLGEALRRTKRPKEALQAFDKALLLMPEFLKAHLGVGNCLRALGRHREAVARFRLALAIDPNFAEAYHYLGAAFIDRRRTADAIPVLRPPPP